ncbi:thioredoxin [Paenibacillus thalictri]|uniref:Thioredoxin n=1 Tax=Paenibacillus thalictri TaxID=2527873 RepID=A0A4Q9DJP6_9BACL|nr:thioredoxin [Paenibacillus thalictri]TBL71201.1 thioredoxin [Paenibacillus thalictri]
MTVQYVNDADLETGIRESEVTMVDFTANWCPPCKALLPILEELDGEYGERLSVMKVNVDESPESAARYGIMSMPTVVIFKGGEAVEKLVGLRPKEVYTSLLSKYTAV